MNWHKLTEAETFEFLGTSLKGLSIAEAEKRLMEIGPNELPEAKKKSIAVMLLAQFKEVMILILLAAAIISGIIGDLTDTIVILTIVVLNAILGFLQEYRAEKAMQTLKQMTATHARILRNGISEWHPASELVPGDLVILEAGNAIPADLRIIDSINLKIQESALTGESQAIDKIAQPLDEDDIPLGDKRNMAFKGTFVTYGRGTGIVVATGIQTEFGKIARMLQETEVLTPLQARMASFGKKLSTIILFLCAIFFLVGWLRGENLLKMILTSISLAVAAIPEALPAVITISLATSAKRMIKRNSLIRKLPAVETLGSVSFICTDKTGTLTSNKMRVEELFANHQVYPSNALTKAKLEGDLSMLLHACALNNDATAGKAGTFGDGTEIALLELAQQSGIETDHHKRLSEIAFDSERKLMTTFHAWGGKVISFTKGAPDILLELCTNLEKPLILERIDEMASNGMRVLGFAYRLWDEMPQKVAIEAAETRLHFLGLAGILDPPREEINEAVVQCKTAGIVPVMITGDHPLTAKAIARRIGIL
ncbi:MAG: HAD-IC family P-type ATPase, partial [Bacteroidota bacterium]|nr:HAD-IC family P-type ATPase [Bacteroidota bacterium]